MTQLPDTETHALVQAVANNGRDSTARAALADKLEEQGSQQQKPLLHLRDHVAHPQVWATLHPHTGHVVVGRGSHPFDSLPTHGSSHGAAIGQMVRGYARAALWSGRTDDGEPLDDTHSIQDIHPTSALQMIHDVSRFYHKHRRALDDHPESFDDHGHYLWLTKEHHGTGFWDHDYPQSLTDDAHKIGEDGVYVGDDKKIHVANQKPLKLMRPARLARELPDDDTINYVHAVQENGGRDPLPRGILADLLEERGSRQQKTLLHLRDSDAHPQVWAALHPHTGHVVVGRGSHPFDSLPGSPILSHGASLGRMIRGYAEAALWSGRTDDGEEPLDEDHSIHDIHPTSALQMIHDVSRFYHKHRRALPGSLLHHGHDLWLTKEGHGDGFIDHEYPEALTNDVRKIGGGGVYVGDDKKIHVANQKPLKLMRPGRLGRVHGTDVPHVEYEQGDQHIDHVRPFVRGTERDPFNHAVFADYLEDHDLHHDEDTLLRMREAAGVATPLAYHVHKDSGKVVASSGVPTKRVSLAPGESIHSVHVGPGGVETVIDRRGVSPKDTEIRPAPFHVASCLTGRYAYRTYSGNDEARAIGVARERTDAGHTRLSRKKPQPVMGLTQSLKDFFSKNQKAREYVAQNLVKESGEPGTVLGCIHYNPERGYRAGVMSVMHDTPEALAHKLAPYLGSYQGLLSQDPQVTAFITGNGPDLLHHIRVPQPVHIVSPAMLAAGFQRFVVTPQGDSSLIHLYDQQGQMVDQVAKFAKGANGSNTSTAGTGRQLGDRSGAITDAGARARYRDTISAAERHSGGADATAAPDATAASAY